ncbi:MAG: hypothetical protein NVS3B20_13830 [Polyangiales bacterium]
MRSARSALAVSVLIALCVWLSPKRCRAAADEVEAFARVVVENSEIRSGPGGAYRTVAVVERGFTLAIDRRGSDQYWLKVTMDDGRVGWILGDEVAVYAVRATDADRPSRPGIFAPPPLLGAHGGLALLAGVIGARVANATSSTTYSAVDGYFEFRPAWVVAPQVALEPYVGLSRTDDGSLTHVGLWGVVHLLPDLAIDPYFGVGGGYLWSRTNADSFAVKEDAAMVARAGGGLLFGLSGRILVRLEATNLTIFTPNRFRNAQSFLGGLGVYF